MTVNSVTSAEATTAVAAQQSVTRSPSSQKTSPVMKDNETSESQIGASKSTVKISNAGKAALQEARETAAQTAREANNGDHQAQRALDKATALKSDHK